MSVADRCEAIEYVERDRAWRDVTDLSIVLTQRASCLLIYNSSVPFSFSFFAIEPIQRSNSIFFLRRIVLSRRGKINYRFSPKWCTILVRLAAYYVCRNQSRNGLSNSEIPSGL